MSLVMKEFMTRISRKIRSIDPSNNKKRNNRYENGYSSSLERMEEIMQDAPTKSNGGLNLRINREKELDQ
jgi:hypothetical protein